MPDTNDGPAGTVTDKEVPATSSDPLPGFAEAMVGFPQTEPAGEPEDAKAVETVGAVKETEVKAETPKESAKTEATPDATKAVNFDGLSDLSKTYWEKALKAGHATPADVDRARTESLFQSAWTKKTTALANDRKAFEAKMAERAEDVKLLDRIRADDRLHNAWLKMSKGEVAADDAGADDLVDKKTAAQVAREVYEQRKAEEATRDAKEQTTYEGKRTEIQTAVREQMGLLKVSPDVMKGYLEAEEEALNGADPILTLTPEELTARVFHRHEVATLRAEAAALREQLNQRTSKQVQASKQSLSPSTRVSDVRSKDAWAQTKADLNLADDLSNVTGFGWRGTQ